MALAVQRGVICRYGPGSQSPTSISYLPLIEKEYWPTQTTDAFYMSLKTHLHNYVQIQRLEE